MLLSLIVKYFFYNRKRTFRAVFILAIGLSLVISTNLLITGFLEVIQVFSASSNNSQDYFVVSPSEGEYFDPQSLSNMVERLENSTVVQTFHLVNVNIINMSTSAGSFVSTFAISNMSHMLYNGIIDLDSSLNTSSFYFRPELLDLYAPHTPISIENATQNIEENGMESFEPSVFTSFDVLVDFTNPLLDFEEQWNTILVFFNEGSIEQLLIDLFASNTVDITINSPSNVFLGASASQLSNLLILLQVAMSFLLILSITYIMVSLIQDSANDIRLMHMIGLGKVRIWLIFQAQSILSSLFACMIAIMGSVVILQILFSAVTGLTRLPLGIIAFDWPFIFITFLQVLIIGVLAGVLPSTLGVKNI